MFKRILVPLDGSTRAERAIPVAARLAHASGGSVIITRVVNNSIETWPYVIQQPTLVQSIIDTELDLASQYLEDIITSAALKGITTESVVLFGPVAPTILSMAHSYDADLIVVCSHGYTGITRWVVGSVAEKVACHSTVPVLVLREGGPIPTDQCVGFGYAPKALVALDGSAHAKAAIEPAAYLVAALAAPARGTLHLTRVVSELAANSKEDTLNTGEYMLHTASQYLKTTIEHIHEGLVAPCVKDLDLNINWSVAVDVDVAGALIRVAENGENIMEKGVYGGYDVIVMATHGREGLQRWAMGSFTERVLNASKLPLLIVRPPEPETTKKSHLTLEKTTLAAMQG